MRKTGLPPPHNRHRPRQILHLKLLIGLGDSGHDGIFAIAPLENTCISPKLVTAICVDGREENIFGG